MGRHTKKSKEVRETAVVELAELGGDRVRTSPRMPATASESKEEVECSETAGKRSREVGDGELGFASSAFVERKSTRRRVVIEAATESLSPADCSASCEPLTSVEDINCASEPASCCSSNSSTELVGDRSTTADPTTESAQIETLTFSGGRVRRSKATPTEPCAKETGDLESTAAAKTSAEANSRHKSAVTEMPSESEIEEFFSAAEKDLQKRFSERYNFDVVEGVPLKGRYEWFPVKP